MQRLLQPAGKLRVFEQRVYIGFDTAWRCKPRSRAGIQSLGKGSLPRPTVLGPVGPCGGAPAPLGSRYLIIQDLGLKDHDCYGFWDLIP